MHSLRSGAALVLTGVIALAAASCVRTAILPVPLYASQPRANDAQISTTRELCIYSGTNAAGQTNQLPYCEPTVTVPAGEHHLLVGMPRRSWPKHWFAIRATVLAGGRYELRAAAWTADHAPSACVVDTAVDLYPQRVILRDTLSAKDVASGGRAGESAFKLHPRISRTDCRGML